ncbi:MAG: flagellar brake protein [bacterium]
MGQEQEIQLHDLSVMIGTELTLEFHEPTLRTRSVLIGFCPGSSVIIRNPVKDKSPILIKEGRRLSVRFLNNQNMIGFTTGVLLPRLHPFPLLHLEYPTEVSLIQVRNARRAEVSLVCTIAVENQNDKAGRIIDLSRTGCKLLSAWVEGEKGQTVRLGFRFYLDKVEQVITLPGAIRSIEALADSPMMQYGIEFSVLEDRQSALINAYVNQTLLES